MKYLTGIILSWLGIATWEHKCWGRVWHRFDDKIINESILEVNRGWQSSIHLHRHRYNAFICTTATIGIEIWDDKKGTSLLNMFMDKNIIHSTIPTPDHVHYIRPGQYFVVPPNMLHRFFVISTGQLVEIYWTGTQEQCTLSDIVRIDQGGEYWP